MTVCIATLFTWQYDAEGKDLGLAVLTTSDRMITAGIIEYEPQQKKSCFLTRRVHIMIAGDYATHSEALGVVQRRLLQSPENDVGKIAEYYSEALTDVYIREASRKILSPVGLTMETFTTRQSEMSDAQIARLTDQLQGFEGVSTEALIVGCDDTRGHIWMIDGAGKLSCQNDVAFAAIGMGAWHAHSQFTVNKYISQYDYAGTMSLSYAAKKTAEAAPGVGTATDMHVITREGWMEVRPDLFKELELAYNDFELNRKKLILEAVQRVRSLRFENPKPSEETEPDLLNEQPDNE